MGSKRCFKSALTCFEGFLLLNHVKYVSKAMLKCVVNHIVPESFKIGWKRVRTPPQRGTKLENKKKKQHENSNINKCPKTVSKSFSHVSSGPARRRWALLGGLGKVGRAGCSQGWPVLANEFPERTSNNSKFGLEQAPCRNVAVTSP